MSQLVQSTKNRGILADTHEGDIWAAHLYQPRGKRKKTFLEIREMPNLQEAYREPGEVTWRTEDGHYVGQDGFLVPKNAEEFFSRYPDYITAYAYQMMHRNVFGFRFDMDTFDEVAAELTLHMCWIQETQAAYKAGYRDRFEIFDPAKAHGAKKGRYFHFVNEILQKKFSSYVYDDLMYEPSAIGVGVKEGNSKDASDEAPGSGSSVILPDPGVSFEDELSAEMDAQSILNRVLGVIKEKDRPQTRRVLEAAMVYDRSGEIAEHLGIPKEEVAKVLRKVKTTVAKRKMSVYA